jgi:hypothetical protein
MAEHHVSETQFGSGPEQHARERKAASILSYARDQGLTSADFQAMSPEQRQTHLAAAGFGHASDETWGMVHTALSGLESRPAPDDPFAGL